MDKAVAEVGEGGKVEEGAWRRAAEDKGGFGRQRGVGIWNLSEIRPNRFGNGERFDFLYCRANESRARTKFPPKGNTTEQRAMTELGN